MIEENFQLRITFADMCHVRSILRRKKPYSYIVLPNVTVGSVSPLHETILYFQVFVLSEDRRFILLNLYDLQRHIEQLADLAVLFGFYVDGRDLAGEHIGHDMQLPGQKLFVFGFVVEITSFRSIILKHAEVVLVQVFFVADV